MANMEFIFDSANHRTLIMRKTAVAIAITMALVSAPSFAQTKSSTQCESTAQAYVPINANDEVLGKAVTNWIVTCGHSAADIVGAAVSQYPDQAVVIAKAAFAAAPDQLNEIIEVIASQAPDQVELVVAALTEDLPTAAGASQSQFERGQGLNLPAGGSGGGSAIRATASAS
ncbi:hypothetical protein GCM10009304_34590 [Pseudomonas matsuisoli]|uniref:Uncharacterized protein n=2 Tax=Pseudomonas matsuisoli TaxID=1515666 RepID=A0A917Q1I2_9PSED|nr:hypothetical protein GCM10009304_34590 [Pseudomonas matsuisoli]